MSERPGTWKAWWLAARPKTLPLSLVPVVVGTALAFGLTQDLAIAPAAVALLAAMLIQIATNLHNDAADFLRGADRPGRLGPDRASASGWLDPTTVKRAAFFCFALATLGGLYLIRVGGWPIFAIGVAGLAAGLAYSGGKKPLSHSPFGELFVFLFFGLAAVAGSDWLQRQTFSPVALAAGAALGCMAAAVLMVNNYRDFDHDLAAGRRTLAIVLGRPAARVVYSVLMLMPYALIQVMAGLGAGDGVWLALLLVPLAMLQIRRFQAADDGEGFNAALAGTARIQALFGLVLAFGLVKWPG